LAVSILTVLTASLRTVSLSLAAVAIPIFGVAMDIGDKDRKALCGEQRYARVAIPNGASPYVELTAGGKTGPFLLDYGATSSALSADAFPGPEGEVRKVAISLPGIEEAFFHLARYDMLLQPKGGQFGVVAGDLLSRLTVQLTPDAIVIGGKPCQAETLAALGLTPIAQAGFFSADPSKVEAHRPNVPVVFLRFGDVRAFAQIDTGYEDLAHGRSVDINQALFERLVQSGIRLDQVSEVDLWTCEGRARWPVYRLKDQKLVIENEQGKPVAETNDFHLVVKRPNGCGGIAEMTEPAAQLGASFLSLFGTVVFDPKNATVWVDGRQAAVADKP
jgi:hypothetical protein